MTTDFINWIINARQNATRIDQFNEELCRLYKQGIPFYNSKKETFNAMGKILINIK